MCIFLDEYCRFEYVNQKYPFQHNNAVLNDVFKDLFENYLASLVPKVRKATIVQWKYALYARAGISLHAETFGRSKMSYYSDIYFHNRIVYNGYS